MHDARLLTILAASAVLVIALIDRRVEWATEQTYYRCKSQIRRDISFVRNGAGMRVEKPGLICVPVPPP
jgi:hypothetical protein